jgi:CheY-like chemotaxis protein
MSKDRNLVLVVDDDPGVLKCVQRLLRLHAYETILFSSAEAFKNYTGIEKASLRHPRHQPERRVRDRAETWPQRSRDFRARDLYDRE